MRWGLLFFAVYDILFALGISFTGDYTDYCILALQYLYICLGIYYLLQKKNIFANVLGTIGGIALAAGFVVGIFGVLFLRIACQEFESDKLYSYNNDGKNYETRRYTMGFVTSTSTRYAFQTYYYYSLLPFEYKIDDTDFLDNSTSLNITNPDLTIAISGLDGSRNIIFTSPGSAPYLKPIK